MSADTSRDVSLIHDEDILRKIMQDTDDFARKKEIRMQMSKLRETRLKEFYNSGEINTEIRRTTTESKSSSIPTHTESIADHSFASMKTKEIRDSESPTRDSCYRITDKALNLANKGWNVVTKNQTSNDGKTYTSSKVATTAGSEKIQGGKLDFAAKNEQKTSVYQDGDDKNFTKAVGAASSSVVKQEASGGDENSTFKSSSTKTSSSSRFVSESRSTNGDTNIKNIQNKAITQGGNAESVTRKVYTNDIPSELKKHPGYVEGKTTVTRETRTLPDGSTVTTTRYEIKGGSTEQKTSKFSTSNEQRAVQQSTKSVQSRREESNRIESEHRDSKFVESDSRRSDVRSVESRRDDSQTTDSRRSDIRSVDSRRDDSQTTDSRRSDVRSVESRRDDSHTNDSRRSDVRSVESRRDDSHTTDSRRSDVRSVESRRDDSQTTDSRRNDSRSVDSKTVESRRDSKSIDRNTESRSESRHESRSVESRTGSESKTGTESKRVESHTVESNEPSACYRTTETRHIKQIQAVPDITTTKTYTITQPTEEIHTSTKTTVTRNVTDSRDSTSTINDTKHLESTTVKPVETTITTATKYIPSDLHQRPRSPTKPERYETPEKRQPIKPGKSELDTKSQPTEGQYDTTYRAHYTNKRISVDVSPTHEAFARSLRAVSPDRISRGSPRTSTTSLRSSSSPEKSRFSPERRSVSPRKSTDRFSSTETITYKNRTGSRLDRATEIDSSTLTRKKKPRSPSPSTTVSDFEFVQNQDIITDLDTNVTTVITKSRPSSLDIKNRASPTKSPSPTKDYPRKSSLKNSSPVKSRPSPTKEPRNDRPLKRTDTYEERCRQILGITETTEKRRGSYEKTLKTSKSPEKKSPTKVNGYPSFASPKSPTKLNEFPSQIRKSPERRPLGEYPEKRSPTKEAPKISEFPSQIRKSPERRPIREYPEKKSPTKEAPKINEFPSQIKKSPEKRPIGQYPERKSPVKEASKICEFPSQIRRSPERQPLEYPERKSPVKDSAPKISEFPSQTRRSPERKHLNYPERASPVKDSAPKISEFPSQIRRSPERQHLDYPERTSPVKDSAPKISEFPSQIRRSPERQHLDYPERSSPVKDSAPKISEFPSQIRRSPERQPLEYPERRSPVRDSSPKICEFPSQIRRSPERQPLEYPERKSPVRESAPKISEFPSQIRRSPERQPLEYPERKSPIQDSAPKISEFPSQIRRSPERQPLVYPERKSPVRDSSPTIGEFPSQIRRSPERRPFVDVPDRKSPERKSPEKDLFAAYPTKYRPLDETLEVTNFLTELRKDESETRKVSEFPSQVRKSPERKPLVEPYPEKSKPTSEPSKISEFPSQIRKSPEREPLEKYPEKSKPVSEAPKIAEFPSQIRRSPERQPLEKYPEKTKPLSEAPRISEFPSQKPDSPCGVRTPEPKKIAPKEAPKKSVGKPGAPTKPSTGVKKTPLKSAPKRKTSNSSEEDIEERAKQTKVTETYEGRTPVEEPLFVKRNSYITYDDDEEETETQKRTTQTHKTVKKDLSRTLEKERSPAKKPLAEKNTTVTITKKTDYKTKTTKENLNSDVKTTLSNGDVRRQPAPKVEKKPVTPLKKTAAPKPVTTVAPKRHVVSTTINVTVKKPTVKSTVLTTKKVTKGPKLQNGHVSSETEEDVTTHTKKITRTTSDQLFKTRPTHKTPVRGMSKPELITKKKVITTKSILINNDDQKEVVVELLRSKSSREPTPDQAYPLPVLTDDGGIPRYPDQIVEPDDGKAPENLFQMFQPSRITDLEPDDSLLSVNKKINKFTIDSSTTKKKGPAPKVNRPELIIDESLESDECLLSVSEKVNKFISTAEQLTAPQDLPDRPKSPKCKYYPDDNVNVSDKVTHFITTAEEVVKAKKAGPAPKIERPTFEVDDEIREDECLLSVSDKVTKFVSSADRLKNKPVSLGDMKPTPEVSSPRKTSSETTPRKTSPSRDYTTPRRSSPPRATTPKRPSSVQIRKTDSSFEETPRRRPSEEDRSVLSPTGRLRSTETIKKAKALFENYSTTTTREEQRQRDILTRPSVFEARRNETLKSTRLIQDTRAESPERDTPSEDSDTPGYMKPLDRSLRPHSPHRESMKVLKNTTESEEKTTKFGVTLKRTDSGQTSTTTTNTVTKSRISPDKVSPRTISSKTLTEAEIDQIYDLELLEELLEKVVSYDLRRKIRTQIRLVKKLISENKLVFKTTREKSPSKTVTQQSFSSFSEKTTFRRSQSPENPKSHTNVRSKTPDKTLRNKSPVRSKSPEKTTSTTRSYSPDKFTTTTITRSKSPEKSSVTTTTVTRSKSPEKISTSTTSTTKVFSTQLKKTQPKTTSSAPVDNVPEWVKARNLRKAGEKTTTSSSSSSRVTTSSSTNTSTFTKKSSRSSPVKEAKPTDIITSSYGVGPTDENGSPLFGLKALRARNDNSSTSTKVQGTVIKSQYYSENGNEPIGEISVTNYSNDPKDLGKHDSTTNKGLTSITTTQKFGYKDTPSLKSLTSTTKKIEDSSSSSTTTTSTSKFERRGSVKALSQKFIDNAVETLKNESKQTSYPKAGLILRTSSFKDTGSSTEGSREGSPDSTRRSTTTSSSTVVKTSSKTTSSGGETFLTNRNRVSGVQDVITRMKTEDVREGDSTEDIEARGLLNKFLGSQVILSGLSGITESSAKSSTSTTKSSGISGSLRKTTKITTTVTEGGKPTTRTRIFQHPITDEELESIWDEQTLRLLLEQSTDYEERRKIRARLRQVMAEQEACTDLVDKASRETSSGATSTFDGSITRKTFTEGPVTTTQVTSTRVSSTQQQQISKKPISPFAKFRQLDKQNSINTPPSTPKTPSGSGPLFKFTDPALNQSANTIKDRLLYWCRMKTKEYENIQLDNFSSSWADGLAFCALVHHFLPDAFDYHALTPKDRRHNFTLAFQVADEKADIAPLLDVDDMVATRRPDWKCVFTYVQSIYRRFKDED